MTKVVFDTKSSTISHRYNNFNPFIRKESNAFFHSKLWHASICPLDSCHRQGKNISRNVESKFATIWQRSRDFSSYFRSSKFASFLVETHSLESQTFRIPSQAKMKGLIQVHTYAVPFLQMESFDELTFSSSQPSSGAAVDTYLDDWKMTAAFFIMDS